VRNPKTMVRSVSDLDEGSREMLWDLGRRIVRLRRIRGWSRDELARRMRVSRERLGHWERGNHTPPLKALMVLSRTLAVTIDELVTGDAPAPGELSRQERDEAARHLWGLNRWLRSLLGDSAETPRNGEPR
jgi:transcriptional regulator with XRE-family HTH domain